MYTLIFLNFLNSVWLTFYLFYHDVYHNIDEVMVYHCSTSVVVGLHQDKRCVETLYVQRGICWCLILVLEQIACVPLKVEHEFDVSFR